MQTPVQEKPTAVPDGHPARAATATAAKYDFMVVSNRLPVDRCTPDESG